MRLSTLRKLKKLRRISAAAVLSLGGLITMLGLTTGVASAVTCQSGYSTSGSSNVCVPNYPTVGTYPNWLTNGSNQTASSIDRSAGSDTTLFMMQQLGNLYNDAGLYGCTLTASTDYCSTSGSSPTYSDVSTTDTVDNFDRTEILNGINDIGSGNGLEQLCGGLTSPDPVAFARSSKPATSAGGCPTNETGYAKDSVPAVDFQTLSPGAFGAPSQFAGTDYDGTPWPTANGGEIGPVAAGWLPGDPINCVPAGSGLSGTDCSGTPFTNITNTDQTSGDPDSSIAFRLWCNPYTTGTDARITDWGQLTNLSASGPGNGGVAQTVGNGAPIGVPIRIVGINTGSGTVATFSSFANSNSGGPPPGESSETNATCTGSQKMDQNAVSGPNPDANLGTSSGAGVNNEIAVENNASQIADFAAADFPNDPADQAVAISTSLYAESYGVYESNPNAGTATLIPGTGSVPSGTPLSYTESLMDENGIAPSIAHERTNAYPTSRTLFNAYNPADVNATVGAFLNWICDSNYYFNKETDLTTGANYDSEIQNIINNDYEYSRLTDTTAELANTEPTDYVAGGGVNATCDAELNVTGNGTDQVTYVTGTNLTTATNVPSPQAFAPGANAGLDGADQPIDSNGSGWPTGTTVTAEPSGSTLTLNNTVPTGTYAVWFPGMPPVLAVTNPNT